MPKARRNRDEESEKPQGARKNRDSGQSAPLKCFFHPSGPGSTKGSGGPAARGLRRPLPASWSPLPSAAPAPQASLAPAPHAWGGRLPCFWPGLLTHTELPAGLCATGPHACLSDWKIKGLLPARGWGYATGSGRAAGPGRAAGTVRQTCLWSSDAGLCQHI